MKNKTNKTYSVLKIDKSAEEYIEEIKKADKRMSINHIIIVAATAVTCAANIIYDIIPQSDNQLRLAFNTFVKFIPVTTIIQSILAMIENKNEKSKLEIMAALAQEKEENKNTRSR